MNNDRIEIGDIVKVNFNNSQYTLCSEAIVLHIPTATGESWRFREILRSFLGNDIVGYKLHYVSEGCTVTLISKKDQL